MHGITCMIPTLIADFFRVNLSIPEKKYLATYNNDLTFVPYESNRKLDAHRKLDALSCNASGERVTVSLVRSS